MSHRSSLSCLLTLLTLITLSAAVPAHAKSLKDILDDARKAVDKATHPATQGSTGNTPLFQLGGPGNDNFANRTQLNGNDAHAMTDNTHATVEPGEPIHWIGNEDLKTVWWTWSAPANGSVNIDTLDIAGHTGVASELELTVYVGDSLGGLTPIVRHYGYTDGYKLTFPVEAGRSYQIVSDALNSNFVGLTGFNLRFLPNDLPPPALGSDAFADRPTLKGTVALAVANNRQATIEPGEPTHWIGQRDLNTVWWTWTAPANGRVNIDTLGIPGLTEAASELALTVYVGDSLGGLTPIVRHYGYTDGYKLTFPVEAGRSYQIVSDALNSNFVGLTGFNLRFAPNDLPPPALGSDAFADRPTLKGTVALAVANNEQATAEPEEPIHWPNSNDANTVWWSWKAPANGRVTVDTLGIIGSTGLTEAASELELTVYVGDSLGGLTPIVRHYGYTDGYKLTFPVEAGRSYQIVSDALNSNFVGLTGFNLRFTKANMPAPIVGSDAFANRTNLTLTVGSALAVANNEQATVEPGEPDHLSGQRNFNTVWWKWTAPVSGTVAIDTLGLTGLTGAAGQTCLVIYTGDSLDSLTHVTTGNGNMDGYKLTFPVAAGRTYQIVSDAPNGNYIGQVGFNLHFHSLYAPAVHPAAHRPQTKPKRKAAS